MMATSDKPENPPTAISTDPRDWNIANCTSLSDVEALLDQLEQQGYKDRDVVTLGNSEFAVRFRKGETQDNASNASDEKPKGRGR